MLEVALDGDRLLIGERPVVSFHRTLRIPDDGTAYPLPPGLGLFAVVTLSPGPSRFGRELAIPMYQREAMWIGLSGAPWKPNAVKVIVGGINAVSGLRDDGAPPAEPQDYLVCPDQPWLDGVNVGAGIIRQFVAMPLGRGYGVETRAGGLERGGVEIVVFEPKPGRFPDQPPVATGGPRRFSRPAPVAEPREMALGAGGRMQQKIYPDRHGPQVWDPGNSGRVRISLANGRHWRELTGLAPPPTPIDAAAYAAAGLPWFALYDETETSVAPGATVPTIADRDRELGIEATDRRIDQDVIKITGIDRGS